MNCGFINSDNGSNGIFFYLVLSNILTAPGSTGTITIIQVGVESMTEENTGKEYSESRESRYGSVWSDLRAIKLLERLQQDVQNFKAAQRNLQIALVMAFILLGGGAVFLGIIYNQLQQLRSQPETTNSSLWDGSTGSNRGSRSLQPPIAQQLPMDY